VASWLAPALALRHPSRLRHCGLPAPPAPRPSPPPHPSPTPLPPAARLPRRPLAAPAPAAHQPRLNKPQSVVALLT
jgi:hypothetical protein